MAKVYADRVSETTTTVGVGTYSLAGAATGFRTFVAGVVSGNTCDYCCTDGTNWETGLGTLTGGTPDTLARTTIYASSNAGAAVNWGAGTKSIYLTLPGSKIGTAAALDVGTTASKVVQLDATAKLPAVDGSQLTNLPASSSSIAVFSDYTQFSILSSLLTEQVASNIVSVPANTFTNGDSIFTGLFFEQTVAAAAATTSTIVSLYVDGIKVTSSATMSPFFNDSALFKLYPVKFGCRILAGNLYVTGIGGEYAQGCAALPAGHASNGLNLSTIPPGSQSWAKQAFSLAAAHTFQWRLIHSVAPANGVGISYGIQVLQAKGS